MIECTPTLSAHARANWEIRLVVGSVALLASLAVADRLAAWLIGEFPTSAMLWQLRFDFLRPVAVFYDIVQINFGTLSPIVFSTSVMAAAALIAVGALSRIRLARALSCHLLFLLAMFLLIHSLDDGCSTCAAVGRRSQLYAMLGAMVAAPALGLCLRIHAEYAGWKPGSLRAVARVGRALRRARLKLQWRLSYLLEEFSVAQTAPLFLRVVASKRFRRYF